MQTLPRPKLIWGLILILLIATLIRVYQLEVVPLRGDEAYTVLHWTATPFSDDWTLLWENEPAPAGAFTAFWLWEGVAGSSEFAMRYLSVLGSIIGGAVIITLARRFFNDGRLALLAGVLWAVHPFLIWHAQDVRVYALMSGLTSLVLYWFIRAVDSPAEKQASLRTWLPYIALQTLTIYLFYFEPFWMVVGGLYVVYKRDMPLLRHALRAWVIIGVLSLPVGAQLYTLMFVSDFEGHSAAGGFDDLFTDFVPTLLFGDNTVSVGLGVVIIGLIVLGLIRLAQHKRDTGILLLLWVLIPPILLFGASNVSEFFLPRYVIGTVPALILAIVGIGAYAIPKGTYRLLIPALFTLIISVISIIEAYDYFENDPPKSPAWDAMMDYLGARNTEHDVVIFGEIDPSIEYYYQGAGEVYIMPLELDDPTADLDHLLDDYDALYVMAGARTGEVGQYLQANAQSIAGDTYAGVTQFRAWEVNAREIQVPLEIQFGDVAILRGYTLLEDTTLLLYWEAVNTTEAEYSVLVHIESSPSAPPEAVLDHAIADARISTRTWTLGNIYRDPIALPQTLNGEYTIRVGIKDGDGVPISVIDDPTNSAGRYPIGILVAQ